MADATFKKGISKEIDFKRNPTNGKSIHGKKGNQPFTKKLYRTCEKI
jgi:hypothetical protein